MSRRKPNKRKKSTAQRQRQRRAHQFQALEPRCMLSAISLLDVGPQLNNPEDGHHRDAGGREYHSLPVPIGELEATQTAPIGPAAAEAPILEDTFLLHSNPGAAHTIFLDFDGHTTSGTIFNGFVGPDIVTPAYSFSGDASFADSELTRIQAIWQRVSEDFIPFDVNVTTEEPASDALIKSGSGDNAWGVRVVIGGDGSWYGNAGGVAYTGSFNWTSDTPVFVFEDKLGNGSEKNTAEAISHEVGHSLGLPHDGSASTEYYQGHGSGATGWAPIMGNSYSKQLTQWDRGEFSGANNTQDDLAVITGGNGFGYLADDHADDLAGASPLTATQGDVYESGIIERNDDYDLFSFVTESGQVSFDLEPFERGPNLDIAASLLDVAGTLLAYSNPVGTLSATISASLAAGEYFLQVTGGGQGDPLASGYSDYGSLGRYTISGSIVDSLTTFVTAGDDQFTVAEDSGITSLEVLANDTAKVGQSLTITAVSAGSQGGSLTIVGGTSISYQPAADFFGQETFTYTIDDGTAGSEDTATVTITVTAVNDRPVALYDYYTTDGEVSVSVDAVSGVLANDNDIEGDSLSANYVSGPTNGFVTLNADGSFDYTPNEGFLGIDEFTYKINDGQLDSNLARVSFLVQSTNVAPTASIAGSSSGVPFQWRALTLTATDPSPADQAAGFTFYIDWDGDDIVDQTVFGPSGTQVTHQYRSVGANTIKVTASDQNAAVSGVVTHAINIVRVEMQGTDLVWGGTTGKDAVEFEETASQTVEVRVVLLDGVALSDTQTFVGVGGQVIAFGGDDSDIIDAGGIDGLTNIGATLIGGRGGDTIYGGEAADTIRGDAEGDGSEGRDVIAGGGDDLIYGDGMEGAADTIMGGAGNDTIYGGDGNDTIYGDNVDISADGGEGNDVIYGDDGDDSLFGGKGNDSIFGGNGDDTIYGQIGNDMLSGGTGNDSLSGGTGKDLLFAGAGADTLHGNGGDDLLVAGAIGFDFIEADLKRIGNEWWSTGSYATRVANIGGTPGGVNDPVFLQPGVTVFGDGEVDTLFGEGGADWFLDSQTGLNPDILSDLEAGEVETNIAPSGAHSSSYAATVSRFSVW